MGMIENSMSMAEARRECERYQHLVGRMMHGKRGRITKVVVAPMDEINKHMFFERYQETGCEIQALGFYQVPYYDIMIIYDREGKGLDFTDLRTAIRQLS